MPQSIFIQVGQCGNQIGHRFWDLAVQEYQYHQKNAKDINNFFKSSGSPRKYACDAFQNIKARAVMIDMEEGVVSEIMRGHLKYLFDRKQLLTDVSGSGNNWAVGNKFYGSKYRDSLKDLFRKEAEECDSLQCFFLLHSTGGGTGSGLGTAILEYLHDDFPKTPKFVFAGFPSYQDDVVTSPYNTVLANSQLFNFADCVIPFDNKALTEICNKFVKIKDSQLFINRGNSKPSASTINAKPRLKIKDTRPFDEMNDIVANTILNLTCSSRFSGSLNIDINEIVMNMAPYPHLHYLVPSISPLCYFKGMAQKRDEMFSEILSSGHQLLQCPIRDGVLLACALLCRGQISMSDVMRNVDRLKESLKFVPWNEDGWKIGLCDIAHVNSNYSLLMLSNTSSVAKPLCLLKDNFLKMYNKKAHLHHFLDVESMEKDDFSSSLNDLKFLIEEYKSMEKFNQASEQPRLNIFL